MEKKVIRAALLGFGTVGTGVYKVLEKQKEEMIPKLGSQLEISKILVRNLQKAASKVKNPEILTNNWDEIGLFPNATPALTISSSSIISCSLIL